MPASDDEMTQPFAELRARYIKAADGGNWEMCRAIGNSVGCMMGSFEPSAPGFSDEERKLVAELFEFACFFKKLDKIPECGQQSLASVRESEYRGGVRLGA